MIEEVNSLANVDPVKVFWFIMALGGMAAGGIAMTSHANKKIAGAAACLRELQDSGKVAIYNETTKHSIDFYNSLAVMWENQNRTAFKAWAYVPKVHIGANGKSDWQDPIKFIDKVVIIDCSYHKFQARTNYPIKKIVTHQFGHVFDKRIIGPKMVDKIKENIIAKGARG